MFVTYILKSKIKKRYYIGSTSDLVSRLIRHNNGRNCSTKYGIPWEVVYEESFQTKQDAYRREIQIKSYKGGEAFQKLVDKK